MGDSKILSEAEYEEEMIAFARLNHHWVNLRLPALRAHDEEMRARLARAQSRIDDRVVDLITKLGIMETERDELRKNIEEYQNAIEEWKKQFFYEDPVTHVKANASGWHVAYSSQKTRAMKLAEALTFYADPETYFAIAIIPDSPCGEFNDDFDDEYESEAFPSPYNRPLPGKRARAALKENDG